MLRCRLFINVLRAWLSLPLPLPLALPLALPLPLASVSQIMLKSQHGGRRYVLLSAPPRPLLLPR